MKATVVALRYHMKEVLAALVRQESVSIFYHRKKIASIIPAKKKELHTVHEHPFLGMLADTKISVTASMEQLRAGRYRDI